MLLGRDRERQSIEHTLARTRGGQSATLALVGEPGIGKTALLEFASQRAQGMRQLRARGIESEAQIPFAALLELLRPALSLIDQISEPQAAALEAALALRPGTAQERFAVGAATLSLLAAYAERGPVAMFIDDAHWLDAPSAQAVLFAVRRLLADPVAVFIAVRDHEPSLLDGADLPTLVLGGLSLDEAGGLVEGLDPEVAWRLHRATAGNPLAMLELAADPGELALAPPGAPALVSSRITNAFLRRAGALEGDARQAVLLAAASESGEMTVLAGAAKRLGLDLGALEAGERAGLLVVSGGQLEFRHPLARSAIYAAARPDERRAVHRALAAALPDRDVDRRAWHLAAAAVGPDDGASSALAQAGDRSRSRSAYATASAAYERAGRLSAEPERRARMWLAGAESAWHAGAAERAVALIEDARAVTTEPATVSRLDELAGFIASRRGPVMHGHAILTRAAARAEPERAVSMLVEASAACYYGGEPGTFLATAESGLARLPHDATPRVRFLALTAVGAARVLGGDGNTGAQALHAAMRLADANPQFADDLEVMPWLGMAVLFLRESQAGRPLIDQALRTARARAALGVLPSMLNLIARDRATTDEWARAEATYQNAIQLARESGQRTHLAFGLSGLAWLLARRGREADCRAAIAESLGLSAEIGARMCEVWSNAALGELELALGDPGRAVQALEHHRVRLSELGITDVDLSPAAELVDANLRLGDAAAARDLTAGFAAAAQAKGQPWSLARALRCQALVSGDDAAVGLFERALSTHALTPDAFELARTRLAFGESLRRARNRIRAREQLRAALTTFERLEAGPWAARARAELAASGETLRRRAPETLDDLTPQELQVALLLASGRTTRETAATLFLSPKTVEYHLRHVYMKLGINSREQLAAAMSRLDRAAQPLPAG